MADEKAEAKAQDGEALEPKKGGKGKIILGILGVLLVTAGGAGGAIAGTRLMGPPPAAAPPPAPPKEEEEDDSNPYSGKVAVISNFNPIVIDFHDPSGDVHHLKLAVTAELPAEMQEKEFELYSPRGREAAIVYLRQLKWEDAINPKKFEEIRKGLSEVMIKALGKKRVEKIVITDYVAQ
ncbi:MAG: flagellar basal body-associated FliL family protein [Polyangiaceae bacterium]|nr:flagellar basal body-associated FliL family protein [Polyangiaceae bacterium]MCB9605900.1 flagellar basal body-associated FliL family protein [Polyangiaceae bacterium]